MWLHASLFVLVLAGTTHVTSGHEHHRQHSHFCQGGGYNLFCNDGFTLKIDKAWFGRIAADPESCIQNATNMKANDTSAPAAAAVEVLAHDCGSSVLDSKDSWCTKLDNGGCNIMVTASLAPAHDDQPCPADVTKYLYLEYECLSSGGSPAAALQFMPIFLIGLIVSRWSLF